MKIFILWVMLAQSSGITLESHEYTSDEACTAAEALIHKKFKVASDWNTYQVSVLTSCTEK